jgi:hypothetical protein
MLLAAQPKEGSGASVYGGLSRLAARTPAGLLKFAGGFWGEAAPGGVLCPLTTTWFTTFLPRA